MKYLLDQFCGEPFSVWNGPFWGRCFEQFLILFPSHVLLLILSAYYMENQTYSVLRDRRYICVIQMRIAITAALCVCPFLNFIGSHVITGAKFFVVDYLVTFAVTFCWLLHIGYLLKLKSGITDDCRGPFKILVAFTFCLTSSLMHLVRVVLDDSLVRTDSQLKIASASLMVIIQLAYCLTLLPDGLEDNNIFGRNLRNVVSCSEEETPLLQGAAGGDALQFDAEAILPPAEIKNIFSRVFFWWLNPLIDKGAANCLREIKDLFALPSALKAASLYDKISLLLLLKPPEKPTDVPQMNNSDEIDFSHQNGDIRCDEDYEELSLSRCLFKCFGWEYIAIGILKLMSDGLLFSGPLLLNVIVSYLESDSGLKQTYSYWYAFGLFVATVLGALITTQYNFQIGRVGLKIRATIITSIYGKILTLNKIRLSTHSSGQIMNFMSTDSDRIVNFCQSFHQIWSLPVQIIIIFYLLYMQVGFSFFVGVVFAFLVIVLNQYIAKKIVAFSRLMMEAKDKRIKVMSELLRGIISVKVHAWEERFSRKVAEHRKEELLFLMKRKYLDALCVYLWAATPLIVAFLTFTTYVLLGNTLRASKIFTSIALFNMLIVPLNAFPWVLNGLMEAWVSMNRIQEFFQIPSLYPDVYYVCPKGKDSDVSITHGIFGYGQQRNAEEENEGGGDAEEGNEGDDDAENNPKKIFFLGPFDIQIPKGQLLCVIGRVGSGKSTLLYSILGDTVHHRGTVGLCEAAIAAGIGFVSQESWIQQGTIRDNILFGRSFLPEYYQKVVEACELDFDFDTLPHGDRTEVGENGFTLSGGQRARVSLARAVYQNLQVYLIDDPFASVDSDVGHLIFKNCILGLLKGKTIVVCTHHVTFATQANFVIYLDEGRIVRRGNPSSALPPEVFTDEFRSLAMNGIAYSQSQLQPCPEQPAATSEVSPQLVQEEERNKGVVQCKTYRSYWEAAGGTLAMCVLFCCLLMQVFRTLTDWWLSHWVSRVSDTDTDGNSQVNGTSTPYIKEGSDDDVNYYLYIYGSLVAFNSFFGLARAFTFAYAGVLAAVNLHNDLLQKILKVSTNFFGVTPMGRILNRFSSDMYNLDDTLPFALNILLAQLFSLAGCLAVTCYGMSWVVCIFIPLVVFYYRTQKLYRCTSRELKRLSSVSMSPLYVHFMETVNGHSTIRALRNTDRFTKTTIERLDENNMAIYATMAAAQWLNLRLQFIGVTVVTVIAVTALLQGEYGVVDPGLVGLTLSYALSLQALLNGSITAYTETEKEMISVERILQYAENLTPEDCGNSVMPPGNWPTAGAVVFQDIYVQYTPDTFPVVEGIAFAIRPGEKIGIIGRTGSGKTTLLMALLRMAYLVRGEIRIDGMDISKLNLKALRSKLSVIPQDPFLFGGTVRENLDPCNNATDEEIILALNKCYMMDVIADMGGLEGHVEEGGQNFSTGEKQLLCLARAILRKSKVVCMDEATSSIDPDTDELVQRTIRAAFESTTLLVIAHRVTTLQRCDFIIVLNHGKIVDMRTPREIFTGNDVPTISRLLSEFL